MFLLTLVLVRVCWTPCCLDFGRLFRCGVSSFSLVLLPALILGTVLLLDPPVELRQVLLVQATMPAAVFPIILARHYGGHPLTAIQVVISTTLLSLITIPLVISLLSGLLS